MATECTRSCSVSGVSATGNADSTTTSDSKVEGNVRFPSRPGRRYRYLLTANDRTLSIMLEDSASKQQWKASSLELDCFATGDLLLPHTMFEDYVALFIQCLDASPGVDDGSCDLVIGEDNAMELRLTLSIRVFTSTWTPTYVLRLQEVPLHPFDVLVAKNEDQVKRLEQLQRMVAKLSASYDASRTSALIYCRATPSQQCGPGQTLIWKADLVRGNCVEFLPTGTIRFLAAGVYMIQVIVHNANTINSTTLELFMNGASVTSCADSDAHAHTRVSSLRHLCEVTKRDDAAVIYRGTGFVNPRGTHISIHRVENPWWESVADSDDFEEERAEEEDHARDGFSLGVSTIPKRRIIVARTARTPQLRRRPTPTRSGAN